MEELEKLRCPEHVAGLASAVCYDCSLYSRRSPQSHSVLLACSMVLKQSLMLFRGMLEEVRAVGPKTYRGSDLMLR